MIASFLLGMRARRVLAVVDAALTYDSGLSVPIDSGKSIVPYYVLGGMVAHFSLIATGVGRSLAVPGDWSDEVPAKTIEGSYQYDSFLDQL